MRASLALAALVVACALVGCGNQQASSSRVPSDAPAALGAVEVTIYWPQTPAPAEMDGASPMEAEARGNEVIVRLIPLATETIELTASGAGISPDITRVVTKSQVQGDVAKVTLYIPPGTGRLLRALAKDAADIILVGGSSTVDVAAGVVTTTGLELGPAQNGKIAFALCPTSGAAEIYTIDPDGSNLSVLVSDPAIDATPCWSPDGTRIAFESNRTGDFEIYAADAGGGNVARLTADPGFDGWPRWSPDGVRIAFHSDRTGDSEVYVMDADGSNVVRLTTNPAVDNLPSWSPDGGRIAFQTDRDGNYEVYTMDADGSDPVDLTQDPGGDYAPEWSPDGTRIAFVSGRDGNGEVYAMDADGSSPVNLSANPAEESYLAWSPDGSMIAFTSSRAAGGYQVFVMDADGSNPTQLTSSVTTIKCGPRWQPLY